MGNKRVIGGMAIGLVIIAALVFGILAATRNTGKSVRTISAESAREELTRLVRDVDPTIGHPTKSSVEFQEEDTAAEELPDLDTNEVVTPATTASYAEIWSSPHKTGQGTDGWLREMAEQFNNSNPKLEDTPVSVQIRALSSGLATDYIATGTQPAGYTPSSMLFVWQLEGRGVHTDVIRDRTLGNVAGILLKKDKYQEILSKYGTVDLKAITEAVSNGELVMGYTNPFTSSTGINFLMSTLLRYDPENPLSDKATQGFLSFQKNVPFVSLTTLQMRSAAENGTLDGMMAEWQMYTNDPALSSNYEFTPFGYRHDNPLVACPKATDEERKILELFAQYCDEHGSDLANKDGFNGMDNYVCELPDVDGATLMAAQKLYKQNKDGGKPVVAVFVADVSGSMDGEPLAELKNSLVNSMRYINSSNYVGLVSYSSIVTIELPIAEFDLNQQSLFKGTVENLTALGATATNDAIVVAANMIEEALDDMPGAKPMLFVLSDGMANGETVSYSDMSAVIKGLRIPVYTIGYNANIDALRQMSEINEATSMNASTDDVVYQLKELFNANM